MVNVVCDSCKKVPKKNRDLTHFSILDKNLCTDCKFDLDEAVKEVMYEKKDYTLPEYNKIMVGILNKMCE